MRTISLVVLWAATIPAFACDKVDYAEAKTWSTAKLQEAYCANLSENGARLVAQLNGVAAYDRRDMELCSQQTALYKRLLEAKGKDMSGKVCKARP